MRYFEIEHDIQQSMLQAWYWIFGLLTMVFIIAAFLPASRPMIEILSPLPPERRSTISQPPGLNTDPPVLTPFHGQRGVQIKIIKDGSRSAGPTIYADQKFYIKTDPTIEGNYFETAPSDGVGWSSDPIPTFEFSKPRLTSRPIGLVHKVSPQYPPVAIDADKEGEVILRLLIDATGRPVRFGADSLICEIISERPHDWFFAHNILKVIEQWRFTPHIEAGRPIACFLELSYIFKLAGSDMITATEQPHP